MNKKRFLLGGIAGLVLTMAGIISYEVYKRNGTESVVLESINPIEVYYPKDIESKGVIPENIFHNSTYYNPIQDSIVKDSKVEPIDKGNLDITINNPLYKESIFSNIKTTDIQPSPIQELLPQTKEDKFWIGTLEYLERDLDFQLLKSSKSNDSKSKTPESPVPEPTTMLMVGSGLVLIAKLRRRK